MIMSNTAKVFFSLLIGFVGAMIAKFVHPPWGWGQLLLFGLLVFAVTLILALVIPGR